MTIDTGGYTFETKFGYIPGLNDATTTQIASINNDGEEISYTYDANWNIETITGGGLENRYYYDELNQLVREDNAVLGKTIPYAYDGGDNILLKEEYAYTTEEPQTPIRSIVYVYDEIWKDKLVSYDGSTITYDEIGNPLNDGTYTYTWTQGRRLASISGDGLEMAFKYNDAGIRTQKTVNGVTTDYHLVGDRVTFETNGTDVTLGTGQFCHILPAGTEPDRDNWKPTDKRLRFTRHRFFGRPILMAEASSNNNQPRLYPAAP